MKSSVGHFSQQDCNDALYITENFIIELHIFFHILFRTGPTTRVPLLALENLPSTSQHQEALALLPSLAYRSTGPREKMRMRLGVSAGSSPLQKSPPLWSEPVDAVRRKNAGWRRRDAPHVLRS